MFRLHPHQVEVDASNVTEILRVYDSVPGLDGIFCVGSHVLHAARLAVREWESTAAPSVRFATFDHSPESLQSPDVVMTMVQPNFEMGRLASEMLVKQISDFHDLQIKVTVSSRLLRYDLSEKTASAAPMGRSSA